jgi:hypothetical protein
LSGGGAITLLGNVSDSPFMGLNLQSEFVPINEQPNHIIVHLNRLGEANRLASQSLNPCTECQVFTLDLLGGAFARLVFIRIEVARVSTPVVRIILGDAKGFQQSFKLQQCLILATTKDLG